MDLKQIARVFPRKTNASPMDALAFFGQPTIENIADCIKAGVTEVHKQRCQENLLDKAAEAIEHLTAENAALREKQQWIPVTERFPERDVQVLGWYKDNPFSQYRPEVVAWNGNGWVFVYAHRYVTNVTHWMPLPEAPEEG